MNTERKNSQLLTRKEAAEYLGTTEGTLAVWSCTKRYGLPFIKVGRLVKYRINDLEDFLTKRTQNGERDSKSDGRVK